MVWYSHLFQNFPQFIVIHLVKGFGIVNKAEIDVFLELSCFFDDPRDVCNLTLLTFCLFILFMGFLKEKILNCFAGPFSSGPRFVRTLHHDPSVLGGPTQHGLVSLS